MFYAQFLCTGDIATQIKLHTLIVLSLVDEPETYTEDEVLEAEQFGGNKNEGYGEETYNF